jgi:hypothetical protein
MYVLPVHHLSVFMYIHHITYLLLVTIHGITRRICRSCTWSVTCLLYDKLHLIMISINRNMSCWKRSFPYEWWWRRITSALIQFHHRMPIYRLSDIWCSGWNLKSEREKDTLTTSLLDRVSYLNDLHESLERCRYSPGTSCVFMYVCHLSSQRVVENSNYAQTIQDNIKVGNIPTGKQNWNS